MHARPPSLQVQVKDCWCNPKEPLTLCHALYHLEVQPKMQKLFQQAKKIYPRAPQFDDTQSSSTQGTASTPQPATNVTTRRMGPAALQPAVGFECALEALVGETDGCIKGGCSINLFKILAVVVRPRAGQGRAGHARHRRARAATQAAVHPTQQHYHRQPPSPVH